MAVLYIFAASDIECRPVLAQLTRTADHKTDENPITGKSGSNCIYLFKTGMGPEAARITVGHYLEPGTMGRFAIGIPRPDAIIVTGFAGSLSDDADEGDVVTFSSCVSEDDCASAASCSADLLSLLLKELSKVCAVKMLTGISSSRVAVDRQAKQSLALRGAAVVDMESYEIISAANLAAIPAAVVRVISDSRDRVLPDFNRALNRTGDFNRARLALVCLGSPIATWRLFRASRRAQQVLSRALSVILKVDISPAVAAESKVQPKGPGVELR
ncbi:MAG: hypothetical protein ACREDR_00590 [Blastocatellia bacterium]